MPNRLSLPAKAVAITTVLALATTGAIAATGGFEGGGLGPGEPLARESILTPDELGDGAFDGLQYADATEGLVVVEAPEASSDGGAHLSYPLPIPAGRGITPELSLDYDSSGGNGWVGTGWDLSVGEVTVDTTFGAPYFDANHESESYTLDGDALVPNALGDEWEERVPGDREDFVRQVETEYEQIIRHEVGDGGPKNYYWEVRQADGGIRWYGGFPDAGGPYGDDSSEGTIDRDAIVTDAAGNQVRWLLSAERDIGYSIIRYHYETHDYQRSDTTWVSGCNGDSLCAQHTYLDRIDYTIAAEASGQLSDPAYQVHFILESELDPAPATRGDPVLDGTGRYLDLVADRLGRIEVRHGDLTVNPDGSRTRAFENAADPDDVAARYDLSYQSASETPFGKSLLASVTQGAHDPDVAATHEFTYFDEVGNGSDGYTGFDSAETWSTGEDMGDRSFLDENVSAGALGGSENNSGEGHAYIGFNPVIPQKVGSFGGSIQLGGGTTTGVEEWIDLNGDGLPDKVFRSGGTIAGTISYRLNQGGPDGSTTFSGAVALPTLTSLSIEDEFNMQFAVEAHLGVTASFGLGTSIAWGDTYFTDVNADGLPDLVTGGNVLFNRLINGVPTFVEQSTGTPVPIATGASPDVESEQVDELRELLADQSPLVDTVRRWIPPFTGTVEVDAPVTLDPAADSPDGVRVAIEYDGTELDTAILEAIGDDAFTTPFEVEVEQGHPLYFRVGSINDGANDEVTWSPVVTYVELDGDEVVDAGQAPSGSSAVEVPLDANGLSQTVYDANADFTLSGRPGTSVVMPYDGTVRFTGELEKHAVTSDDLRLVLEHNGVAVTGSNITIDADFIGSVPISLDFDVAQPVAPTTDHPNGTTDTVRAYLAVDSPIDLNAITWTPELFYIAATDGNGDALEVTDSNGEYFRSVDLAPEIEQYPIHSSTGPVEPWESDTGDTLDAVVSFSGAAVPRDENDDRRYPTAVLTVKTADGVVAQESFTLISTDETGGYENTLDLNLDLDDGTDYWFEVTTRDVEFARDYGTMTVELTDADDTEVDATFYGADLQGIFPLAYRGWGLAGYTANGDLATQPIDDEAFVIDADELAAQTEPSGFEDVPEEGPDPDPSFAFLAISEPPALDPALAAIAGAPLAGNQWRGNRDNLAGGPERMRSSRLASDNVDLGAEGGSGRGVTRLSTVWPSLAVGFGFGPLGGSVGVGTSQGVVDYEDLNGDGYPDVLVPQGVQYTTQRGALGTDVTDVGLRYVNQDFTVNAQGGLDAGLVNVSPNSKGRTNATSGNASGKGGTAAEDAGLGAGFGIAIGGGVDGSWTNPNDSGLGGSSYSSADLSGTVADQADIAAGAGGGAAGQQELADVNGDGLPDRVTTNDEGVWVQYNLGYGFSEQTQLATGGFGTQESIGGSASAGFATPWGEFSGGASFSWNYDMVRYAWIDVNGDGILDRLHKASNAAEPTVTFGTGSGLYGSPVTYGAFAKSAGVGAANVDASPHIGYDRAQGIGGGFDFTVYAGPLCLVACYLVINPGASYQNSVSFTEVTLDDINGDGYIDSLSTTDDDEVSARLNLHGKTNLLQTVANPLGGSIDLDYERDGNTYAHPDSIWTMSKVSVNDGRPGDGVDVLTSTFEYDGLAFDRLFRQSLGYSGVIEHEMDAAGTTAVRDTTRTFLNDNIFTAGLETSTELSDASTGDVIRGAYLDWEFREIVGYDETVDPREEVDTYDTTLLPDVTQPAALGTAIAPLAVSTTERWYDGSGAVGQETRSDFSYDGLGNILVEFDHGEIEDPNDDLETTIVFSDCEISSGMDPQCPPAFGTTGAPEHPSPYWSETRCPTWVSMPAVVTVTNGAGEVYRHSDGSPALCDNAGVTHLEELVDGDTIAVTDLAYDEWGSYNRIVYPEGEDGVRYAVEYVYDADRHSDIAQVTEYDLDETAADVASCSTTDPVSSVDAFLDYEDCTVPEPVRTGLTSTAMFDGDSGRIASRTDANGNTTSYEYDSLSRIWKISNELQDDVVEFLYNPTASAYGYAIAKHHDQFNADTIDTISFVDGLGRVTEEKRDARVVDATGAAVDGRIVTGATNFDELGRAIEQYRPVFDTVAQTAYEYTTSAPDTVTTTEYTLTDLETKVTEPGGRVTTTAYDFADVGGVQVFSAATTDPRDRVRTTFSDVRGNVRAFDDEPTGVTGQHTEYEYDGIGQLLRWVDPAGEETVHEYDQLGNRLSTETPDGGLVEFWYDAEGKLVRDQSATLREEGYFTDYSYELRRLVGIDYPEDTPDVTYTYGAAGAPGNGAGRVVQVEDGSQITSFEYDALGAVIRESAEVKLHNWEPDLDDASKFTWVTEWTYDALGRLASMVYPDGERLAYDYDSGGLITTIIGEEDGQKRVPLIDAAGNVVIDEYGNVVYTDVPHTWEYPYVDDRRYDEFLRPAAVDLGNGVTTQWTYDYEKLWLTGIHSDSPNRDLKDNPAEYSEIQDLRYTYDDVGNPRTYTNDVPEAVSNLFGGVVTAAYDYDEFDRLIGAAAKYETLPKDRTYQFQLSYDDQGNVLSKSQVDKVGKKVQAKTSYSFDRTYATDDPHQAETAGEEMYHYDADGELTHITTETKRGKIELVREMEWDWAGHMVHLDDASNDTDYTYDDQGQLAIERGPSGETAFINPWVSVRNGTDLYKHIWLDDERIGTQRDNEGSGNNDPAATGGYEETQRYFLHTDLQGSTNVVTGYTGDTFQHQEYFPTGEVWVAEHSTQFRTPYQFAGGYTDEQRAIISLGERWYDQRREMFTTVDPVLVDDPMVVVGSPELRATYAYAGSNPISNVDPSGNLFFTIASANDVVAKAKAGKSSTSATPANTPTATPPATTTGNQPAAKAKKTRAERLQAFAEKWDAKPLFDIDRSDGTVKFAPLLTGPRIKLKESKQAPPSGQQTASTNTGTNTNTNSPSDATNSTGGPTVQNDSTSPTGSTSTSAPGKPGSGDGTGATGGTTDSGGAGNTNSLKKASIGGSRSGGDKT
ncbi:hypothetical protein ARHIZOSPH14_25980 [Agromyces rhizosphaerae]|uniref:Insecticide toxin TcdB middle/N-terminal domain-containing protein n=1 Tax=Agromyces rhizosphaerae TaxID=88374 RepID=A0A9W6CYI3_9MICO|nr:SpvB/TcaC N-terminal domain-containing protein [Agromyces rhizosphaerae]GLI28356.1 hypothetical protein ARHIZOSPH14_25980 [Agromyces rhizosphaerae]